MVAKKKGLGKIRIKSTKRIILSAVLLIAVFVVILALHNAVFSVKSKEASVNPVTVPIPSKNVNMPDNKEKASDKANVAETKDFSSKDAMGKIGESIIKNKDVRVKVVNHTRVSGLAEKVRAALEINGFKVSAGNDNSLKNISSVIIEKKDSISGDGIVDLIGIKRIKKELDPNSRFDIVVILGDDFFN